VRLSRRRLNDIALRRLNCSLKGLDERDGAWVERQFRAWLLDTVLDPVSRERVGSPQREEPESQADTG
jgi:hypothetical protein